MTAAKAVLDANVFLRSAVQRSTDARAWLDAVEADELDGHVPELLYAELGNAFLKYVRAEKMTVEDAAAALKTIVALPLRAHRLAGPGAERTRPRGRDGTLVYDCCYAVLAESLDAPLVTGDRRLADAVPSAELLS